MNLHSPSSRLVTVLLEHLEMVRVSVVKQWSGGGWEGVRSRESRLLVGRGRAQGRKTEECSSEVAVRWRALHGAWHRAGVSSVERDGTAQVHEAARCCVPRGADGEFLELIFLFF